MKREFLCSRGQSYLDQAFASQLAIVERLCSAGELNNYHLLYAVRADLLQRLGRLDDARMDFLYAAELSNNEQEKSVMEIRATECVGQDRPS